MLIWTIAVIALIFLFFKIHHEHKSPRIDISDTSISMDFPASDESDDDKIDLKEDIEAASSADELMDIAEEYEFDRNDSDTFLRKVRSLNAKFDKDDWATIYESSEEGSELERIAEERAGDALL